MARKGFSLIELLVVIAVLSLLASLVSTSLRKGRQYSEAVVCAGNLKQLSLASQIYVQNNDTLPYGFFDNTPDRPPGGPVGDNVYDWAGWWWFHFMYDSLSNPLDLDGSLWCPSRFVLGNSSITKNVLIGNYGANFSLFKVNDPSPDAEYQGIPIRPDILRQPARTPLFLDSGYAWVTWHSAKQDPSADFPMIKRIGSFYIPGLPVNKLRDVDPDQLEDALNGRHLNHTINVVFADGHTERNPAETFIIEDSETGLPCYSPLIWSSK